MNWSDDRLDDLSLRMDAQFKQVNERFDRVETDLREMRSELNDRFDRLQLCLIMTSGAIIAALLGILATQL